jgi:hypothetical protein
LYWTIAYFGLTEIRVIASTIILGIELVFEVTQIRSSGWDYFMHINNLFDMFIIICHLAFVYEYYEYYDYYLKHQE